MIMWLRWVVSNLLNEMAEEKVQHVVERAKHLVQTARGPRARCRIRRRREPTRPRRRWRCCLPSVWNRADWSIARRDVVTTECPAFVEHIGLLDGRPVMIAESGVGQPAAAQATEDLIKIHHPQWIVSTGFAGALVPDVAVRPHSDGRLDRRQPPSAAGGGLPHRSASRSRRRRRCTWGGC